MNRRTIRNGENTSSHKSVVPAVLLSATMLLGHQQAAADQLRPKKCRRYRPFQQRPSIRDCAHCISSSVSSTAARSVPSAVANTSLNSTGESPRLISGSAAFTTPSRAARSK